MQTFAWNHDQLMNMAEIERQHSELAEVISQMECALGKCQDRNTLSQMFRTIQRDTKAHFESEEQLMEKLGYPGYEQHKAEHDCLLRNMSLFASQYVSGETGPTSDICVYLKSWLSRHIGEADAQYISHIKSCGSQ